MSTPFCHRLLKATVCFCFLLPTVLLSQVTIREKVDIKPSPGSRLLQTAFAAEIRVESSFDGPIDPTYAQLVYVKGPCGVNLAGGISGILTAPAYEGTYKIGYTVTSPSGGQFRFAVYLGDSLLWLTEGPVSCPNGCTLKGERDIPVYAGFTFWPQYSAIWVNTENFFGAAESTSTVPCSPGVWKSGMGIELEITKGRDVGRFVDAGGRDLGFKITRKLTEFNRFMFVADGTKGYGDVEITARSGGVTVVKGFRVLVHPPRVQIQPPYGFGLPYLLSFANLPVIEFEETHWPGPGERFEPVITWEPDSVINTAAYYDRIDDTLVVSVKVKAENPGGIARDSVQMTLVTQCIKVEFNPAVLSPGDTASLSFQRVRQDGTLEDFPVESFQFSVTILGGADSSKGMLLAGEELGTTLIGKMQPIYYIAPATVEGGELSVTVLGAAEEIFWWKLGEVKGRDRSAPGIERSEREGEVLREKKEIAMEGPAASAKTDSLRRLREEKVLKAAMLSSWCPLSRVVVKDFEPQLAIVEVVPSIGVHEITVEPMMPSLSVKAILSNTNWSGQVTYSWRLAIQWVDDHDNTWRKEYYRASTSASHEDSWVVDWEDAFIGGDEIKIEVSADLNGRVVPAVPLQNAFKILGRNPDKDRAIAGLETYQRVVMYWESRYKQFEAADDGVGFPLVGEKTPDYGIMQVHVSNHGNKLERVWNWVENKRKGLDLLQDSRSLALAWPKLINSNKVPAVYGIDVSKEYYRYCPEHFFTEEQLLKETYARYNGRGYRTHYWLWRPSNLVRPSSGGSWYRDNFGGSGQYADILSKIYRQVIENDPPRGW